MAPLTSGARRVLVVEFWDGPCCSGNHRCMGRPPCGDPVSSSSSESESESEAEAGVETGAETGAETGDQTGADSGEVVAAGKKEGGCSENTGAEAGEARRC